MEDWFSILGPPIEETPPPKDYPHWLIYYGDDEWEVEHPAHCDVRWNDNDKCGVGAELSNNGLSTFFTDDPEDMQHWHDPILITVPGRYLIEYWVEKYTHHEYGPEWNSGINLMYPEEETNVGQEGL
jgi:hypothetical protein